MNEPTTIDNPKRTMYEIRARDGAGKNDTSVRVSEPFDTADECLDELDRWKADGSADLEYYMATVTPRDIEVRLSKARATSVVLASEEHTPRDVARAKSVLLNLGVRGDGDV